MLQSNTRYTKIRHYCLSVFLIISLGISAYSQDEDLRETFLEAESYFLFEEYNEALPLYTRINRADPDNNNINYKIGICLLKDPFQKDRAIDFLLKATKDVNPRYKINNYRERSAPLEAYFYLANAYLVNDSIDKALENYEYFLEILDEKTYNKDLVLEQIETCKRAAELQNDPVDIDYENLGELINSNFTDLNPILSGDRSKMIYVSERRFYDATMYSEKFDGIWQGPRMILPELGVDADVYPTSLSYDGSTMIIYRSDEFVGNLYYSTLVDGMWTEMVKLGPSINTKYWESHGTLSKDGNLLYFTSNRKGGYGGLDIYVSEKLSDGTWGSPKNLGPTINTKYNEDTPFFTENEDVMYFSSFGHNGMGGYDIFYSKRTGDDSWSDPVNVGYPINTTSDDLFFFPVNNGNNAYMSENYDGGFGGSDLYYLTIYSESNPRMYDLSWSITTDEGPLTDEENLQAELVDLSDNKILKEVSPDAEHMEYIFSLKKGNYRLQITGEGFVKFEKYITINKETDKLGIHFEEAFVIKHEYVPQTYAGEMSRIIINDSLTAPPAGDTALISMTLKENSSLTATHTVDSLEIKKDSFHIEVPEFEYPVVPEPGDNLLAFEMVEQNGDTSLTEMSFSVEKPEPILPEPAEQKPETKPAPEVPEIESDTPEIHIDRDTNIQEVETEVSPPVDESDTTKGNRNRNLILIFVSVFLLFLLIFLRRKKNGNS